ncbi:hypothetical protein ACEV85_02770 [Vibrio parahaemolyticus]|uniref:hypothetical protein n=1 Tax=Vibrio TaxID=662 RepID=UPI0014821835|nr:MULTISPECIES: hypothetical protein [Vibrio]MCA2452274.1 hydrogenase maturation nickel metallochaperone HypA [Vibrio alginolyticus]MCA2476247.1 hydrogenase maturation nickel metallochaperone HypA [Vibrio alginolyticus]MCX8811811.1 hydrogenase maturation nickel metallochaperone HypA [Vibrio parahaemolyticus]MCX8837744.1 hydrogenase maturation nickel metallochaperone HypA [Vibrio parahaemolyticus]MCX8906440.1 hydrogenase maturation nickel metallochaperone HypA [Vibrio parahaemolyticus]
MALITCNECGKEFSDKAPSCPNCGCPTHPCNQGNEATDIIGNNRFNLEKTLRGVVDFIFGLIYVYISYSVVFKYDTMFPSGDSEFVWIGFILGMGLLILFQKIIRSVLGTIGKAVQALL